MSKYKVSLFYDKAIEYKQKLIEESELDSNNWTEDFHKQIKLMIETGESITIVINGQTRKGKSTAGMPIAKYIYEILKTQKRIPTTENFGLKNIARDQTEYMHIMSQKETEHTVVLVDEITDLDTGGENATAEQQFLDQISNVQASRYVYRIFCTPTDLPDINADILLTIVAQKPKEYKTLAKLYYRWHEGTNHLTQYLGYIEIDVKDIIQNWTQNVEQTYKKRTQTQEEKDYIKEQANKDWYVKYIVRKQDKMKLITEHGYMRQKELKYAGLKLDVINKLKLMCKIPNMINNGVISAHLKYYLPKYKFATSIWGDIRMTDEISGILTLYKTYFKLCRNIETTNKQYNQGKLNTNDYDLNIEELKELKNTVNESITLLIDELQKKKQVNDKLLEIDEYYD